MKSIKISIFIISVLFICCNDKIEKHPKIDKQKHLLVKDSVDHKIKLKELSIKKDFLYNEHTLEDTYPYKDTVRLFQWEKIRSYLTLIDSIQSEPASWGILQNKSNKNGESPLVKNYYRNEYKRIADTFGIERFQGIPLYLPGDSTTPERYGLDGSLVKIIKDTVSLFIKATTIHFNGDWMVPKRYVKFIDDSVVFSKVIFVDRANQNIATLEKVDSEWLVRSMNPATTGLHKPPLMQETPIGIFVIQEKKIRMIYLKDNSVVTGGFAPYANRFCNGGYIHGIPVNEPRKTPIEFSSTLGTTPRSHMCVRIATSHSKFIYDWAPTEKTLVIVFD